MFGLEFTVICFPWCLALWHIPLEKWRLSFNKRLKGSLFKILVIVIYYCIIAIFHMNIHTCISIHTELNSATSLLTSLSSGFSVCKRSMKTHSHLHPRVNEKLTASSHAELQWSPISSFFPPCSSWFLNACFQQLSEGISCRNFWSSFSH